ARRRGRPRRWAAPPASGRAGAPPTGPGPSRTSGSSGSASAPTRSRPRSARGSSTRGGAATATTSGPARRPCATSPASRGDGSPMSAHADALHALRDGPPARWWHPGVVDTPNEAEIREQTTQRLEKAMGTFGTAALASMEENLPWFRRMPPDQRSWIGLVAQAGIAAFVEWFKNNEKTRPAIAGEVFGTAPRELMRSIKLHHTIDMIRVIIEVVETRLDELAAPGGEAQLREAILRYTRDVAFGAAQVYARAAETRAAWDARLEALVVNAVLRGEVDDGMHSWAAALGWTSKPVTVIAGFTPEDEEPEVTIDQMQIAARRARADVL